MLPEPPTGRPAFVAGKLGFIEKRVDPKGRGSVRPAGWLRVRGKRGDRSPLGDPREALEPRNCSTLALAAESSRSTVMSRRTPDVERGRCVFNSRKEEARESPHSSALQRVEE